MKATPDGAIVRLGDVSRVELAAKSDGFTRVGDRPAALLAVRVDDGRSATDDLRKKLAGLEKTTPKGLATGLVADLSADRFAAVELRLPVGAPVAGAEKLIRCLPRSPECLAFSEREPNAATILVKLPAKDGPTPADIRKALAEIRGASVRASDLSAGRPFPVRVAVLDRGGHGREKLRAAGDAVVKRLGKDGGAPTPPSRPTHPPPASRSASIAKRWRNSACRSRTS